MRASSCPQAVALQHQPDADCHSASTVEHREQKWPAIARSKFLVGVARKACGGQSNLARLSVAFSTRAVFLRLPRGCTASGAPSLTAVRIGVNRAKNEEDAFRHAPYRDLQA